MAASDPASVAERQKAERLVADLVGIMLRLGDVLDEERAHLAAGRIRAGLALESQKSELATAYLRGLETLKANAVAIKRLAPASLTALRTSQETFQTTVLRNQTVLETARAVSEGLVRTLAAEVERRSRPSAYGGSAAPKGRPIAGPLAVSTRL